MIPLNYSVHLFWQGKCEREEHYWRLCWISCGLSRALVMSCQVWEEKLRQIISLIPHSSPIMTCGIPLPSDIIYSGHGTSSHEVKVLWCLILFLINVENILAYAAATFPQTVTNSRRASVGRVLLVWVIKALPVSTEHTSLWFLSRRYVIFNLIGFAAPTFKMSWAPHAVARACATQPVFLPTHSCVLTPGCSWVQACPPAA